MLPTVRRTLDNPFAMLREFDRAFQSAVSDTPCVGETFAVDVYERDDTLTVEAELPGYTRDQVRVNVEQGVLTIEANRSAKADANESDDKNVRRHLRERTEQVTRRFSLPSIYDTNRVDAKLENGVLTLSLPKREEVKPRSIEVK
ncbi:MAG: Hsp20/alpha crystallin family protein [Planctomycetota bacterium]